MTAQVIPFQYTIKAIETEYKGCLFRSRLEARWAAFFDFLDWKWEYEPFDCAGWIPDFQISGVEVPILVEVKPIDRIDWNVTQKIDDSNWTGEVLLLGDTLFRDNSNLPSLCIGWCREGMGRLTDNEWEPACLGFWPFGGKEIGYCHSAGSWRDRITGFYDGDNFELIGKNSREETALKQQWQRAGNKVRWKK